VIGLDKMTKHLYQFVIQFKNGKVVRKMKRVANAFEEMLNLKERLGDKVSNIVFKRV
jgi:hypothetical protein